MWFGHVQLMFLSNKTNFTQHDLVFIFWSYTSLPSYTFFWDFEHKQKSFVTTFLGSKVLEALLLNQLYYSAFSDQFTLLLIQGDRYGAGDIASASLKNH